METATVGLSAQGVLAHGKSRIQELEAEVLKIDAELRDCQPSQVSKLMDQRRSCDDERHWLSSKMDQYKRDADAERWAEMREALNETWAPLAQRRIEATKKVGECTQALIEALQAVIAVHNEQRAILVDAVKMDPIAHKNSPKIQPQIATLDFHEQQARLYVATMLRPMMPQGGRFAPQTLETDEAKMPFRDFVL